MESRCKLVKVSGNIYKINMIRKLQNTKTLKY